MKTSFWAGAAGAALLACSPAVALAAKAPPTATATAGLEKKDGLVPVYVDAAKGRILVSLPAPGRDGVAGRYLYVTALKTGLGSAPVGLDRARLGDTQVLAFRRVGGKVLAEFENPRFRAGGAPADEQAAAREAFATSVVWAGKIEEVTAGRPPRGGPLQLPRPRRHRRRRRAEAGGRDRASSRLPT